MSIGKLLTAGLLSLGILVGGTLNRAMAAPVPDTEKKDDKKDEKKDENGSGDKKQESPFGPAFDDLFKQLGDRGAMTPEQVDQLRKQIQKAFEQMDKQLPGGVLPAGPGGLPGGLPNFPNFPALPGGLFQPGDRVALRENLRLGA